MREIDATNVGDYLRATGRAAADERITAVELTGGVSNMVLHVTRAAPDGVSVPFILKQARPQLRVARTWLCSVERNWREIDFLRACASICDTNARGELHLEIPRVLWEDRGNYLFAMSAACDGSVPWKEHLLSGHADNRIAAACGTWLGRLHSGAWHDARLAAGFSDRSLFDALRLDPYYRGTASVHPDLAAALDSLIDATMENATSLVHADFSPKNLLVKYENGAPTGAMVIDFETGHFGDPAFDVGFFLTHLTLKAFYRAHEAALDDASEASDAMLRMGDAFMASYDGQLARTASGEERAPLARRSIAHLAACSLARLDGKSPVEYLRDDGLRHRVRTWARRMILDESPDWNTTRDAISQAIADLTSQDR